MSVVAKAILQDQKIGKKLFIELIYLPLLVGWLSPAISAYISPVALPIFAISFAWVGLNSVTNQISELFSAVLAVVYSRFGITPNENDNNKENQKDKGEDDWEG